MALTRRAVLTAAAATAASAAVPLRRPRAQAADTIRIGVLTDLSGNYRDVTGPTSVACAQLAVEEFTKANPGIKVEVVSGDHLNKPDVAATIVRQWFDRDGVDMVTDVGNSACAIAVTTVAAEKDKAHVNTSAGSSVLTGKYCSANQIHWVYDTWNLSHTMTKAVLERGGNKWFFITADYTFGHSIEDDTTSLLKAAGGAKVGSIAYPFPGTTDFSSYLLQAQASGANVLALANAGDDVINCIKQAREFGLTGKGLIIAAMVSSITAVNGAGLAVMQNVYQAENFYWDMNDRTRAFMARLRPHVPAGVFPNNVHAGGYSATLAYLETVKQLGVPQAKASGRAAIAAMKARSFDDDAFGKTTIRPDGRALHPSYLFRVKTPAESKGPGDVYDVLATVPADEAFRPMADGGCPLVKS